MAHERHFAASSRPIVRPWWTITIWNSWAHSPTTIRCCWGGLIRGLWRKKAFPLAAIVFAGAVFGQTPTLETLARNYRKSQTDPFRTSLQRFASTHAKDAQGARALFALGAIDYERKRYTDAITNLQAASKRVPKLADYSAYLEASAQSESGNYEACVKALDPVWTATPDSPLRARAAMLAATA